MRKILLTYVVVAGSLSGLDVYTTLLFLEQGHTEANPLAPVHDVFLLLVCQFCFTVVGILLLWFGLKFIHRTDRRSFAGDTSGDPTFSEFWKTITTVDNGSLSLLSLILSIYWVWIKLFCVIANVVLLLFGVGLYNMLVEPIGFLSENLQYSALFLLMGLAFVALAFLFSYLRWRRHGSIFKGGSATSP